MSTYTSRRAQPSPFIRQYRTVPGEGPIPCRLMIVGERPGEKEAVAGRPFVGPAGEMLNTLLTAADLNRAQIYITNLVPTFAEYAKPTAEEIREWGPQLLAEIEQVTPEIIAAVGTYAVEFLLHRDRAEMERTHGVPVS